MNRRVSILGCGWLGKAVGVHLLQCGYQVAGSTTQREKFPALETLGIQPHLINLSDEPEAVNNHFFDSDILIIAVPPKLRSAGGGNYVQQMLRLREIVLNHQVRQLIFVSSTAVYPDLNRVVTESDADPTNPLVAAENIFVDERDFKTTVIRFGGLVGPARHPGRFLAGKKDISGKDNPVNIIHQKDCVRIIEAIIQNESWNETFNAAADLHPSKEKFYTAASTLLNLDPPTFSNDSAPFKIINSEKLKQKLSFEFHYPDPMMMFT